MMEFKTLPKKLILVLSLFLTIIPTSQLLHSRKLSPIPALAPVLHKETREEEAIRVDGSIPVACHSKCHQCMPCMPIQVFIEEDYNDDDENEQYYPQVWRCSCGDKVFSP
ncbi:EPIDERMAL PATTERNING FACTOR-like protein 8 [Lycium barbarum]|uniref:EPIDERMAL PATTERNING FACTOR-like protein 8 n=1 Tax=Lycium barbarum TaxID=112863 RepID=UPI00293E481C|nr:EPIDERMAL PATTERNING FACTOR-like protein 8 [Lycium barbarum]